MRKIYLLLNIIFIAATVLLLGAYSRRVETAVASAGKKNPPKKKIIRSRKTSRVRPRTAVVRDYTALLADSKLFEKDRGEEENKAVPVKKAVSQRCDFKLMGICCFGELKGAIIVSNSGAKNPEGKTFFKIGEDVGDGFKLYEVTEKTAILKSGNRKVELELAKVQTPAPRPAVNRPRVSRSSRRARPVRR